MSSRRMIKLLLTGAAFLLALPPIGAADEGIQILAVTVSASFSRGLPSTVSLGTIFCTGLRGFTGIQSANQYPLPYAIAGVSLTVYGSHARLLAVADMGSYQQINYQMPVSFPSNTKSFWLTVTQNGATDWFWIPSLYESWPWDVFFTDGMGYGAAQHADYSRVTPDHPARPGEVLVAYGTNLEQSAYVRNSPVDGYLAPADPLPSIIPSSALRSARHVILNGVAAEMFYSGLTPGLIGVFQVNFRVPYETPDGDAILKAATDTICVRPGEPNGYCNEGKTSLGVKIPVRSSGQ